MSPLPYTVELGTNARKDFERLDGHYRQRVAERLKELASDPFDPRLSKHLVNVDARSSRVGGFRIVYAVNREARTIVVSAIGSRGKVYRRL